MALRKKRIRVGPGGSGGDAGNTNTAQWTLGRPGIVRFIAVNYVTTGNAEFDLVIKRDSTTGATVFTKSNNETDIAATPVGSPGAIDEGQAVTAATDGQSGGIPFTSGLFVSGANMDDASYADVDIWYDTARKKSLTLTTDGSGDATMQWNLGRPGAVRFLQVDYSASAGAGTTMLIKADTTGGRTLFTKDSNEADFGPVSVGMPAIAEDAGALAATDGVSGGWPFSSGLYMVIAAGGSGKVTTVSCWYDA